MANLNARRYNIEIHYKSPGDIERYGPVLHVMWFEDARVVSDGIKCYPTSTATNNYNNWGPINDLQVILQLPTIEPYYQLFSFLLKCLQLVTLPLLLMSMDSINSQLHTSKVMILFLPYEVLMLDNTVKEYIILMFSTDLLQHSPSLTANMITKTIKTCML